MTTKTKTTNTTKTSKAAKKAKATKKSATPLAAQKARDAAKLDKVLGTKKAATKKPAKPEASAPEKSAPANVIPCTACGRPHTRSTTNDTELCPECWEVAGIDNEVNDNGKAAQTDGYNVTLGKLLHLIERKGGDPKAAKKSCDHIDWSKVVAYEPNDKLAAAVSQSWADKKVRASRLVRHAFKVGGKQYASMATALKALGLPLTKVRELRAKARDEGKVTFEGKTFVLVKGA